MKGKKLMREVPEWEDWQNVVWADPVNLEVEVLDLFTEGPCEDDSGLLKVGREGSLCGLVLWAEDMERVKHAEEMPTPTFKVVDADNFVYFAWMLPDPVPVVPQTKRAQNLFEMMVSNFTRQYGLTVCQTVPDVAGWEVNGEMFLDPDREPILWTLQSLKQWQDSHGLGGHYYVDDFHRRGGAANTPAQVKAKRENAAKARAGLKARDNLTLLRAKAMMDAGYPDGQMAAELDRSATSLPRIKQAASALDLTDAEIAEAKAWGVAHGIPKSAQPAPDPIPTRAADEPTEGDLWLEKVLGVDDWEPRPLPEPTPFERWGHKYAKVGD
ncbi:hypothetical protein GCM10027418_24190 [Mariniluteicoccus endophyticus]